MELEAENHIHYTEIKSQTTLFVAIKIDRTEREIIRMQHRVSISINFTVIVNDFIMLEIPDHY